MSKLDLIEPQRQAPLGVAIIFFKNLRRALNFVLAVIVVNLGTGFEVLGMGYSGWGIILSVFFLIYSFLQYRKFYFYVSGDNFVIEKGVLRQEKINVPFSRIQSVNTRQNIIQRLLNLVGLKVDTAGSIAQEIDIPALSKDYAEELRNYLMQKRYEFVEDETLEQEKVLKPLSGQKPLLSLSLSDLLKVGFTQNHLRSGLILFAIVNGYIWQFEEYLIKPFEPYLEETAKNLLTTWFLLLPFAVAAFLIISVLTSLVSTVLRYYGFSFYLTEEGLEMESGLFNRNSYNVPYEKIQYFRWESNPLRRIIGYRTLKVKQAGNQAINERKLIGIPGLKSRPLLKVIQKQYPDRKGTKYSYYQPHKLLFLQRLFWLGLLPSLVVSAILFTQNFLWYFYLPIAPFLILVAFLSYKYWRSIGLRVNANYVELRRGYVFPKRMVIPNYKLQNLSLSQSFLQGFRKLQSFHFHSAAGTISMAHLPDKASRELYDYLAYCIESSNAKWM